MITIPKDINAPFKEILDQESINVNYHSYYLKLNMPSIFTIKSY